MLHLHLFGGVEILLDNRPLTGFVSSKVKALLIYLVINQRPIPRDLLTDLLWGEMGEKQAKSGLRVALSNLRKIVGDFVMIDRQTAGCRPAKVWVDVGELVTANTNNARAMAYQSEIMIALEQAIEHYKGDFLAGFFVADAPAFEEWQRFQQERLGQIAQDSLFHLATYARETENFSASIRHAQQLLQLAPWQEEGHRLLMGLLADSGQVSAALMQYEKCRQLLATELGIAPSPQTIALYDKIRASSQLPREAPADSDRSSIIPSTLSSLPPRTTFIGRAHELEHIRTTLQEPTCRLLTILGVGGVGKTSLAVIAAHELQADFPDGIHFVSMADVAEEDAILSRIATQLGLISNRISPLNQLTGYLRGKKLLLILDNFEQLVEKTDLHSVLLDHHPNLKILTTSRQKLNSIHESTLSMVGLPLPTHQNLVETTAFEIFRRSAQRAQLGFALSPADTPLFIQLCQLVDGLPLGLTLAGTWTRYLSMAEIVAELETSVIQLASPWQDGIKRHRSLAHVVASSWRLLSTDEQKLLAKLSVFRGGFTGEAAQAVAGANRGQLWGLLDKSLLQRRSGRYFFHAFVWQFVAEQAEKNDDIHTQHADYYQTLLITSVPIDMMAEMENLRAAFTYTTPNQDFLDHFANLHMTVGMYNELQALLSPIVTPLLRGITLIPPVEQALSARFLLHYALACLFGMQIMEGVTATQAGFQLAMQCGDNDALGLATVNMAYVQLASADWDGSTQLHEQADGYFVASSNHFLQATNQLNHAFVQLLLGNYEFAIQITTQLIANPLHNNPTHLIPAYHIAGLAADSIGEHDMAYAYFQTGLALGSSALTADLRPSLALNLMLSGKIKEAYTMIYPQAADNYSWPDLWTKAFALNVYGLILYEQDDTEGSITVFRKAVLLAQSLGEFWIEAFSAGNMAFVQVKTGALSSVQRYLENYANREEDTPYLQTHYWAVKANYLITIGDKELARELIGIVQKNSATHELSKRRVKDIMRP